MTTHTEPAEFLDRWLAALGLRPRGFRRFRRRVLKRVRARLRELGLRSFEDYARRLEHDPTEKERLDALCRITISRFFRNRGICEMLCEQVLPQLRSRAADRVLACASLGCASGEEPYTLAMVWHFGLRARLAELSIDAVDVDPSLLQRALRAVYSDSSLRDLPPVWRETAFAREGGTNRMDPKFAAPVRWRCADLRHELPDGPFDLVLCRNSAFTYFDLPTQRSFLKRLAQRMRDGAALVIGAHESLQDDAADLGFAPWEDVRACFRRTQDARRATT